MSLESDLRERKQKLNVEGSTDLTNQSDISPKDRDDDNGEMLYTIKKTFRERLEDAIYSLIGNGYDLVTKPHTATWLVLFMAIVTYYACFVKTPGSTMDNIRSGVLLVCLFVIVFGANQFKEGPITRPHPVVWKIILAIAIIYECFLLFILSLSPDDARQFMKFFDSSLGEKLRYRDYAVDCRIYIPENPDHFKNVKDVFGDIFILAHFLGWIWKAFIFRDWRMLWILSVWFECLEVTAEHILPNFQECWWDKMIADVFGCNFLGMCIGMWINKLLATREYNWVNFIDIPDHRGRAKRFLKQFSPSSWKVYHWDIFSSFKSMVQCVFVCVFFEIAEMNAFFLKSVLWLEPGHYLVVLRLVIWGLLSLPAVREGYDFFHDPNNHRLGQNFWTAICILFTECLIDYKMGEHILYGPEVAPFPTTVKWCWAVFVGLISLWVILYFIFGGGRVVYSKHATGSKWWEMVSRILLFSIPIPMLYLLFWDMALKPHISFDSYAV